MRAAFLFADQKDNYLDTVVRCGRWIRSLDAITVQLKFQI